MGLLASCDFDNSTFSVDFKTDPRILQGRWQGLLKEDFSHQDLIYSPGKNLLAATRYSYPDSQVEVFDGGNGLLVKRINIGSERCWPLRFQPQGQYLTCQLAQGRFKVWNTETWQVKDIILRGPPDSTTELAHSGEFLFNHYTEVVGSRQKVWLQKRSLESNKLEKNTLLTEIKDGQWLDIHHIDSRIVVYSLTEQNGLLPTLYLRNQEGNTKVLTPPQPWCDSRNSSYIYQAAYHQNADGSLLGTTLDDGSDAVVVWNTGDGSIAKQFVPSGCSASFRLEGFTASGLALVDLPSSSPPTLLYWNPEQGYHKPLALDDFYAYVFQGDAGYGSWFAQVGLKRPGGMVEALQRHTADSLVWSHEAEHFSIPLDLKAVLLDAKTYTFSGSGLGSDGKTWNFSGKGFANRDHVISQRTGCGFVVGCPQPMGFTGTLSHPDLGSLILRGTTEYGSTDQIQKAYYSVSITSTSEKPYAISMQK